MVEKAAAHRCELFFALLTVGQCVGFTFKHLFLIASAFLLLMNLTFQREYKSIKGLPIDSLPNFTIITGLNGAGKTHLLEAIHQGALKISDVERAKIKYYDWRSLAPKDVQAVRPREIEDDRDATCQVIADICAAYERNIINDIFNSKQAKSQNITLNAIKHQLVKAVDWPVPMSYPVDGDIKSVIAFCIEDSRRSIKNTLEGGTNTAMGANFNIYDHSTQKNTSINLTMERVFVFKQILAKTHKPFFTLNKEDCFALYPIVSVEEDPFVGSLINLFAGYIQIRSNNATNQVLATEYEEDVFFLNKEDFLKIYGLPPWEVFNHI